MINKECEIVRDLIPNYVEKTLSKVSNEFIETHIDNCKNCNKILKAIQKEKTQTENQEVIENNYEIDYLKKYNRKIKILKYIISIFIIVSIATGGTVLAKYIKIENDYNYNHNIITTVYQNLQELKQEENFSFIKKPSSVWTLSFYYKNGKYKLVSDLEKEKDAKDDWIDYGFVTENGYKYIQFYKLNDGRGVASNDMSADIRDREVSTICLEDFYNLGKIECASLEIRDDIYQEKECYVLRKNNENDDYEEIWVDKESMMILKENTKLFGKLTEERYSWSIGNITNEDIMIKDTTKRNDPVYDEILEKLLDEN